MLISSNITNLNISLCLDFKPFSSQFLIRKKPGFWGWQPRKIILQVKATTDTTLTIHQFYYPGWVAKLKGSSESLPIHFSELGLLQISVPSGKHELYITLDTLIEERIGQIISAVSAILLLFLVFQGFLSRGR
ncbi:MAG: hypothetical protein DSM106950_08440 [Stigonema ocellatum SAG 48.90 = DSM 106950]|nr:hypothetical protein [Stigonema ocellatum SAG 48.90 = DSM 106950]